jgi:hypothetical protein
MTHPDPVLTFAFEARVTCSPPERIGNGESGEELWFTPITGGTVDGPRLQGEVVAGGGDWSTTRGEVTALDARYLFRSSDGALIDIVNRGYWRESDKYYRTSPVFRTDAAEHRWLAATVFVGMAREDGDQVCIRFYELA